nr:hypothetical protein [Micromonospora sp. DSM 115978]
MATAAERQRRSRAHRRGDHSLCDPSRRDCHAPVTAVTPSNAPRPPQLGTRGRRLWTNVTGAGPTLRPTELVLLEEACRTADRCDHLDRILRGDENAWLHLRGERDEQVVRVVVTEVLQEVRQQQAALKGLLAELRQSRSATAGRRSPSAGGKEAGTGGGGGGAGIANLTARIAARRGQAQS